MRTTLLLTLAAVIAILAGCGSQQASEKVEAEKVEVEKIAAENPNVQYVETDTDRWRIHDTNRPAPPVITPDEPGGPWKDAIVLFNGKDLTGWTDSKSGVSKWIVRDGYMESVKGSGPIRTEQEFGSCQLHVEFATPSNVQGSSQGRGNSGVFLQGEYEVQVLDSYGNFTYPGGQCGALYGRAVPLVNACLRPGEWQSYDIIFHRPTFKDGRVDRKARFTILHNGVLIHDSVELQGGTQWRGPHKISDYSPHGDKGPIMLQDHGNPVQFRNIWIRELAD